MKRPIVLLVSIGVLIATFSITTAQSGDGYDLTWSTIDNGGGQSSGGEYNVIGSIGQADTGKLSGGEYLLSGGFWGDITSVTTNYRIFLPMILR